MILNLQIPCANVSASEEDWDAELSQDMPVPAPTMSQVRWEDNPRMKKIYRKKRESEIARQMERQEELAQAEDSAHENLSQDTYDGENDVVDEWKNKPKIELNMNKVVKGGRKLFVRNINFKVCI